MYQNSKKIIVLTAVCLLQLSLFAQRQGTGYRLGNANDKKMKKSINTVSRGLFASNFAQKLPESYSLKKYCPSPGNQSPGQTCAAWATAYGAYTTLYAIKYNLETKEEIDKNAFSAIYVYEQGMEHAKNEEITNCESGAPLDYVAHTINNYGICLKKDYYQSCEKGRPISGEIIGKAEKFRQSLTVLNIYSTGDYINNDELVERMKTELSNKQPIVLGIRADDKFDISNSFTYKIRDYKTIEGHGVLCVGYDNNKNGGSFEILNSWGQNWGDNGYFYINYADIKTIVENAVILKLNKSIEINENNENNVNHKEFTVNAKIDINVQQSDLRLEKAQVKLIENGTYEIDAMRNKSFNIVFTSGSQSDKDNGNGYLANILNIDPSGTHLVMYPPTDKTFFNNYVVGKNESRVKCEPSSFATEAIKPNHILTIPAPDAAHNCFKKSTSGREPIIVLITPNKDLDANYICSGLIYNKDYKQQITDLLKAKYSYMNIVDKADWLKDEIGVKDLQLANNEVLPIIIYFNN